MDDLNDVPESLEQWVRQISARQAAQSFAISLLFDELIERNRTRAENMLQQLRRCAAAPMGSGVAQAIEALADNWTLALHPPAP